MHLLVGPWHQAYQNAIASAVLGMVGSLLEEQIDADWFLCMHQTKLIAAMLPP